MSEPKSIYRCHKCKLTFARDDLVVKRVVFAELGAGGRQVRSRSVGFLCRPCLEADPVYKRVALDDSPGHPGRRKES